MNRIPLFSIFCVVALCMVPLVSASYECTIYRDGYVHIDHEFSVLALEASVEYAPVGWPVELLTVTDGNGAPLYYEEGESGITIFTLGTESVLVSYDTAAISSKEGAAWTVAALFDDAVLFELPEGTTIVYTAPLPDAIDLEGNTVSMEGGDVELTYILSYAVPSDEGRSMVPVVLLGGALAFVLIVVAHQQKSKKGAPAVWESLDSLDAVENRIMAFIASEGPVLESEVRERFDIPKTSSWRMMRRLEEQGHITVERKNRVNIIRLNKKA